jgi:polysaccharide biosynthesis transport protein
MRSLSNPPFQLNRYWLPLKYHPWLALITGGSVLLLCVIASFLKTPIYQAEGKLQIEYQDTAASQTPAPPDRLNLNGSPKRRDPISTSLETLKSIPILEETIRQLKLRNPKDPLLTIETLQSQLAVMEAQGSDVLNVQYRSPDAQAAASVVNTLMQVYLNAERNTRRDDIMTAQRFVSEEMPRTEQEVQQLETALRQFKQTNQIAELQEKAKFAESQLNSLTTQIADTSSRLADVTAQVQERLAKLGMTPEQAVAAITLSQSNELQNLLNQIQQTETRLIQERERLTEEHPDVLALQNNLNELQSTYQARSQQLTGGVIVDSNSMLSLQRQNLTTDLINLESSRKGLERKLADLSNSLTNYQKQVSAVPRLEQQHRDLERRLQVTQSTFAKLLQQKQEMQLLAQQSSAASRILSPAATPFTPVDPNKLLYAIAGCVLGGIFAYGAAYLAEALNQSVRTSSEARHIFTDWNILGIIPVFGRPRNIFIYEGDPPVLTPGVVVRDQPNTPASESFRRLQVTLCALQAERSLKSIILTSSIEREGKSTLCANLGAAMAQAGQRVLLIDANLNHPYQHELWELPNEIGVTNILLRQVDSQQALQTGMNRLDVMTAGTTVPHPAALLENQPIAALLQELASYYDWILIDTPAINRSADALLWSNAADGIVLTVRPPILDTVNAALANETLKISQQPLLGMVINAAETERKDYQYLTLEEPSPSDRLSPSDRKHQEILDVSPSEAPSVNSKTYDDEVESSLRTATVQPAMDALKVTEEELLPVEGSLFDMPIKALQSHIDVLRHRWEASAQLTSDLEEEQELQEQLLSQLDSQINLARQLQHTSSRQNKELNRLKVRWTHECEHMQHLSHTLSKQRTKLEQQQAQWEEAVSILTTRQRNMMSI